jgi:hypothetical protein
MPSESFRPEFHRIDEVNFDPAFVNSDKGASKGKEKREESHKREAKSRNPDTKVGE